MFQEGSLSLWRNFLKLPSKFSNMDRYHATPFIAKSLNLPGILMDFDFQEKGTREIDAHWLFPVNEENEQEKVLLYFHGGGYCAKDWQAYLNISQKLCHYTKRSLFCKCYG
jgi:acetyl esterase/lipase